MYIAYLNLMFPVFLTSQGEAQKNGLSKAQAKNFIYQGKEQLRPWSKFPGREHSDYGLSLGCLWGRGR